MMAVQRGTEQGMAAAALLQPILCEGAGYAGLQVSGLAMDSRAVQPGYLFFACCGATHHGMEFVEDAVERGAILVLAETGDSWPRERILEYARQCSVLLQPVSGLGARISAVASRFYGEPAASMRVVGITGTNGKTSVSQYIAQALPERWHCALMGTTGNGFPGSLQPATHTTADAINAQRILAELRDGGALTVAMEVSSHALDQHRVAAVPFHTAVFTNLSRDHLDYHGTMDAYADAKATLFAHSGLKLAVINGDDPVAPKLVAALPGTARRIMVHMAPDSVTHAEFVSATRLIQDASGLVIEFDSSWGSGAIKSPLLGRFNGQNLLLVLAVLLGWGIPLAEAVTRLEQVQAVDGRMQRLGGGDLPLVIIDYAHTPDALEQVLGALQTHVRGRLFCLFGCGGDRDQGKRPLMGAVAERLADKVIVTDDNPRHESSEQIIQQVLSGMRHPEQASVVPNRGTAIRAVIREAGSGDVVLIAGKGHEHYQQIGDLKHPFDDVEQAGRQLREAGHG